MIRKLIAIICAGAFLHACTKENTPEKVVIDRFDIEVAGYPELDSLQINEFISRYHEAIAFVTKGDSANVDSALKAYAGSNAVTMFGPDILQRLPSTDSIETALGYIKKNAEKILPSARWRSVTGIISTYNQSVILADNSMLIGLNHYLGSDYPAYSYFEPYQRKVKTSRHLPYDVAEALIVSSYPYNPTENPTLLNRLLYEGAITLAINELIHDSNPAESMGYDTTQWEWLKKNEKNMWKALIDRQLLFSINPDIAERMTRQAPSTSILHPDTPGRAGRYLGYRIVESYRKQNPEKSLEWLLSPEFYNSETALIESKYSPK